MTVDNSDSKNNGINNNVHVSLSRPHYRLGGTIVGTIRVTTNNTHGADATATKGHHNHYNNKNLQSIQLCVLGLCRLDPRWHSSKKLSSYNTNNNNDIIENFPFPSNTYAFWSSGCIELMNLPERKHGSWEETRPKPIILPGKKRSDNDEDDIGTTVQFMPDDSQKLFTFRVQLPFESDTTTTQQEAVPTLIATSCRYYYVLALCINTDSNNNNNNSNTAEHHSTQPRWMQIPITVLSQSSSSSITTRQQEVVNTSSNIHAMAHSNGLPVSLTATEINKFDGQWTVNRYGTALYKHITNTQSMRVIDPQTSKSVCFLTILGTTPYLYPGCRILLKIDFPRCHDNNNWVPCYSVSSCLQGEEIVITTKKRARKHLFSTAHHDIDPETTECITLLLTVPQNAPCTIQTNIVHITVQCLVDIAIQTNNQFRNLRLEIPCQIVNSLSDWERKCNTDGNNDDDDGEISAQYNIIREEMMKLTTSYGHNDDDSNNKDPIFTFPRKDIRDELKILSLSLADTCNLLPKPSGSSS